MPKSLQEKLAEKGWTKEEIEKVTQIIEAPAEQGKVIFTKKMNPIVYWMTLIVAIIGNMLISVILIPFLLTVKTPIVLYFIIALLGVSFGFLFNVLLTDIEHIDPKHHIIAGIFIPAIALMNIFIVVNITNTINKLVFQTTIQENSIVIGLIYVAAFIGPYAITKLNDYLETRKKALA